MYTLTYKLKIKKNSLTTSTTLVEKKYCSSWFTVQVLMMSHSTTFHSVYFELSIVPKRETIEGSRSLQSSSVFSQCLIFQEKNRKKSHEIAKNRMRFFPTWKNRFQRINNAGSRAWGKNRAIFSGELFSGREFLPSTAFSGKKCRSILSNQVISWNGWRADPGPLWRKFSAKTCSLLFVNLSFVDFLKESRWLYDGPNTTGCCDGVPSLPKSIVTDHGEATVDLEILTQTSADVTWKISRTKDVFCCQENIFNKRSTRPPLTVRSTRGSRQIAGRRSVGCGLPASSFFDN